MANDNYFEELLNINVNSKVEKKNGLSYLSWAFAWAEIKKHHPSATYTIYENESGWNYFTDGRTGWVKTGVSIKGLEHIEYLPVMDYKNKSIPLDKITSFDVNKTIQRSLTKACARHGLGLYIYAGEDLPEAVGTTDEQVEQIKQNKKERAKERNSFDDMEIFEHISEISTIEELEEYYKIVSSTVSDKDALIELCKARKEALKEVA